MIKYPDRLPRGLHSGRSYQLVSPLIRSELVSGRARQRRSFTDVPELAKIQWLFTSSEGQLFEAWWRDALTDGVNWFECPLQTPMGYSDYTCRFTGVYSGPVRAGPDLWSYSAELELQHRAVLLPGWSEFPIFVLESNIIDLALNREWPLFLRRQLAAQDLDVLTAENGTILTEE